LKTLGRLQSFFCHGFFHDLSVEQRVVQFPTQAMTRDMPHSQDGIYLVGLWAQQKSRKTFDSQVTVFPLDAADWDQEPKSDGKPEGKPGDDGLKVKKAHPWHVLTLRVRWFWNCTKFQKACATILTGPV